MKTLETIPSGPKRSKTETLSLRLDPKIKFMLEFLARVEGQSITTVVERAVRQASANKPIVSPDGSNERYWSDFWDSSEGFRTLSLIADKDYETTFEEDELHRFTVTHWPFFYVDRDADVIRRPFVDLLWPRINEYLDIWREKRHVDYWAAGKAMAAALSAAKVAAPEWPIATKSAPQRAAPPGPRESFSSDLDDEIPF